MRGVEPPTCRLQIGCSAIELHRRRGLSHATTRNEQKRRINKLTGGVNGALWQVVAQNAFLMRMLHPSVSCFQSQPLLRRWGSLRSGTAPWGLHALRSTSRAAYTPAAAHFSWLFAGQRLPRSPQPFRPVSGGFEAMLRIHAFGRHHIHRFREPRTHFVNLARILCTPFGVDPLPPARGRDRERGGLSSTPRRPAPGPIPPHPNPLPPGERGSRKGK